jgi:hypothetical protein
MLNTTITKKNGKGKISEISVTRNILSLDAGRKSNGDLPTRKMVSGAE